MIVAVYFTNWSIYARGYEPARLPLAAATHVIYAFFVADAATGRVAFSDAWADVDKPMPGGGGGCLGELRRLRAEHPHLRIVASVGGYNHAAQLAGVLRGEATRRAFVDSVVELLRAQELDGVDLDWEYPESAEDAAALTATVAALRQRLPDADLMVAAPAGEQHIAHFPMELDRYLTCWNLMCYDFAGPWSPAAGHHAQLRGAPVSVESVVARYSQHIDPSRLVVGIPLYGRSFAGARAPGQPFSGSLPGPFETGVHDFKTLPLPGHTEYTDAEAGAAFCVGREGLVSYDNAATVEQKARFVRERRLGGGMFWEASGDAAGERSLIAHFARVLRS